MKCTLNVCPKPATEQVEFTIHKWLDEKPVYWPYCAEHIDTFAESLRKLGKVVIQKVPSDVGS
jgi:hypothetical protein